MYSEKPAIFASSKAYVLGLGAYLPERRLTNVDLEKLVDTSDEWIFSRTGMRERRIAGDEEFPSDMGAKAASIALERAHVREADVQLIIAASMSPDHISPSTAALIQAKMHLHRAAAFDVQAACSGFLYALGVAKAFVESGTYQNVLVVATEKMSAFMDYRDRSTCVLFGDGAAAALVSSSPGLLRIDSVSLGADGSLASLIEIPAGGSRFPASQETLDRGMHYFKMAGREVYKHAIRRMRGAVEEALQKRGLSEKEIHWLIPHQANIRIIEGLAKDFQLPLSQVYTVLDRYGNTSASGVGIALEELVRTKSLSFGEHLVLTAFGGGLTWGAVLLTVQGEQKT